MSDVEKRIRTVIHDEVSTCAGHTKHGPACNCERTAACIVQRFKTDLRPLLEAWLTEGQDNDE